MPDVGSGHRGRQAQGGGRSREHQRETANNRGQLEVGGSPSFPSASRRARDEAPVSLSLGLQELRLGQLGYLNPTKRRQEAGPCGLWRWVGLHVL